MYVTGRYINKDIEDLLDRIGFLDNMLVESIFTTLKDKNLHSAPIGVKRIGRKLTSKLFKDTTTYRNIITNPYAVINLLDDIEIFYIGIFSEIPVSKYNDISYKTGIKPLKDSSIIIEVYMSNYEDCGNYIDANFKILGLIINNIKPCFYTRCKHAVLESLIHYTRIDVFKEINPKEAKRLSMLVEHYYNLVNRICPEYPYRKIMREILERIK